VNTGTCATSDAVLHLEARSGTREINIRQTMRREVVSSLGRRFPSISSNIGGGAALSFVVEGLAPLARG